MAGNEPARQHRDKEEAGKAGASTYDGDLSQRRRLRKEKVRWISTCITVVALEQAVAAPYASSRLADAGARVIKIERAEGDFARRYDLIREEGELVPILSG